MSATAQLWKTKGKIVSLGYPEADAERAFADIRLQYSQYQDLRRQIESCTSCPLSKNCKTPVAGAQARNAKVMVIGNMPSPDDVLTGVPFTGVDGYVLTIILNKLGVNREDLYLTNMVKCNKPSGKEVTKEEAEQCLHHLLNEIAVIKPEVIVTLGQAPLLYLNSDKSLTEVRGEWFNESHTPLHIPVMPTHHPDYLIELEGKVLTKAKKEIWADLQQAFKKAQLL